MKVLLSSLGSRGDVQPLLALALELRMIGHEPRVCVAPNFKEWAESFGFECTPIGPDVRKLTGGTTSQMPPPRPSAEQRYQLAAQAVRAQFPVLTEAARGCDVIVGAGALQIASRSVAEALRLPYLFAAYCPAVLPSADHPPPKIGMHYPQSLPASANLALWAEEEQRWNDLFGATLNEERSRLGLAPVASVLRHILTDQPWLAADPVLAPPGAATDVPAVARGAWLLPDKSPLPEPLAQFLASGEPPVYLGFGSMRAAPQSSQVLIEAARALGLRSVVSQGWGNLAPIDAGADCLAIGEVAHDQLFPRVAAVVHHGGAGTTTAAARAGKAQVVVPHLYDQYYWAHRVQTLGAGTSGPASDSLTVDRMVSALSECLHPEVTTRAQGLAGRIELYGARLAARHIDSQYG